MRVTAAMAECPAIAPFPAAHDAGRRMSNFQLRTISAIILGAAVLAITWIGDLPFRILAALITLAILYEWTRMARAKEPTAPVFSGDAPTLLLGFVFAAALVIRFPVPIVVLIAIVSFAILAGLALARGRRQWDAAGYAYAALSGLSLAALRHGEPSGLLAIIFLFAVVWSTDIFAYFVGRSIGGPKLAPSISPGKTWSGALGGTVFGVAAGLVFALAWQMPNVALLAVIAGVLSIASQAGDLFESWVKRRHGVKDSGWIIPGHGGVMDRVDGLVAAAFVLFAIGAALSGADHPANGLFPV